ncbi:MAG TPA: hypothetical protein VFV48_05225, partial [Pseudomonadales bacterium]|nr:hypothetical protein [Pseudomonadales bacterium]
NVSHSVVVSNIKVKRTNIPKLLKNIRKVTEENSQHRHAIIHRHSYMEPKLKRLELLYMHDRESWGVENKTPYERLERARALRIKKLLAEYRSEFEGLNTRAQEAVSELFSGLEREYKTQLVRLSKV